MKVKGKLEYKDANKKKKKKRNINEDLLKKEKKIKRQCECNHVARNTGKSYFKKVKDDNDGTVYDKCLICKDLMIKDKSLLTKDSIVLAGRQISTVIGLARNKIKVGNSLDNELSRALYIVKKLPDIVDELSGANKKKKKNKNNSKKKKSGSKGKRKVY